MARVSTAWSVSARSVQPLFIAVGGVLAAWTSPRWSLGAAAALCLLSGAFGADAHQLGEPVNLGRAAIRDGGCAVGD